MHDLDASDARSGSGVVGGVVLCAPVMDDEDSVALERIDDVDDDDADEVLLDAARAGLFAPIDA